ncbi:MAG: exopolysaccharide biosynthesis polyprenyl glycosylphosphotransferase [Oscillospiraceae bacterium]|nr:exopolysaccharide biosynthesis polyprenyl glycosylphosphotransferase [Oscillospiraceae bacterium]
MNTPQAYIDGTTALKSEECEKTVQIHVAQPPLVKNRPAYFFVKRSFDIIASFFGLILLFPFLVAVAIAIRADSKGKAIFTQTRIGKSGKPFKFYKFRSMDNDAEEKRAELMHLNERDGPVFKINKDPRITRVGSFIRKYSIDELPQLINILRGEMSFVGPRPPLSCEVEQYSEFHKRRLEVRGGLTCYWQISGRSNVSFDDWVRMDLKYIEEMSLAADVKIFLKTFKVVLKKKGSC